MIFWSFWAIEKPKRMYLPWFLLLRFRKPEACRVQGLACVLLILFLSHVPGQLYDPPATTIFRHCLRLEKMAALARGCFAMVGILAVSGRWEAMSSGLPFWVGGCRGFLVLF